MSKRGQKHISELVEAVRAGHEAVLVFVIQRGDCAHFAPSWEKDREYSQLLLDASKQGVQVVAVRTEMLYKSGTATVDFIGTAIVDLEYKKVSEGGAAVGATRGRKAGNLESVNSKKPRHGGGEGA